MSDTQEQLAQVRAVRAQSHAQEGDNFQRVALPQQECDALRDVLVKERARVVLEVGLAYGNSALAIGEALVLNGAAGISHVLIDPHQQSSFANAGWQALRAAGLGPSSRLISEPSSIALARLTSEGFATDAAFVDGNHRFHEVFVDLYYLRKLVRPGGLIVLDDAEWPSVGTALRYFDVNLGWRPKPLPGRLQARRLPAELVEPPFADFKPFNA